MAHTYAERQAARARMAELARQLESRRTIWRRQAQAAARARFGRRADDCRFNLGCSGETHALRLAFNDELERLGVTYGPMVAKLERKIERTRRFFGFND